MKYEQGTEGASSGSNEMDSTDMRSDYEYTTSKTEVVCQTGINSFSGQILRQGVKGTLR